MDIERYNPCIFHINGDCMKNINKNCYLYDSTSKDCEERLTKEDCSKIPLSVIKIIKGRK